MFTFVADTQAVPPHLVLHYPGNMSTGSVDWWPCQPLSWELLTLLFPYITVVFSYTYMSYAGLLSSYIRLFSGVDILKGLRVLTLDR